MGEKKQEDPNRKDGKQSTNTAKQTNSGNADLITSLLSAWDKRHDRTNNAPMQDFGGYDEAPASAPKGSWLKPGDTPKDECKGIYKPSYCRDN